MNTNYTLILLKDGRNILVSDEKIKNSDCQYNLNGIIEKDIVPYGNSYKIIAGIEPLQTLTYSDEVKEVLKTNHGWVDVEELAIKNNPEIQVYKNETGLAKSVYTSTHKNFIDGFKAHQSITNKMFSEKDIEYALKQLHKVSIGERNGNMTFKDFLNESLQQPIQLNVEVEMEYKDMMGIWYTKPTILSELDRPQRPKINSNSILITKILN